MDVRIEYLVDFQNFNYKKADKKKSKHPFAN